MSKNSQHLGFTLTELLVAMVILVLIVGAIYSGYVLSQKAYREGEMAAEINQNGRVILERMVREIRQTKEIVTSLSATSTDATSTIEFEDGHIVERYHYIHYFKEDNNVKREVKRYYFSGDPATYVVWNATPPPGEEKLATTTKEAKIIGEYVTDLGFWGGSVINIFINLKKADKEIDLETKVFGRNL